MEKKPRRVVKVNGRNLSEAYFAVSKAVVTASRERRCVDRAEEELTEAAKIAHNFNGTYDIGVPQETVIEFGISKDALIGVKIGLVQVITGVSLGRPAAWGTVKRSLLPAAAAFDILGVVRKEAKLDEEGAELDEEEIECDSDPKAEAPQKDETKKLEAIPGGKA